MSRPLPERLRRWLGPARYGRLKQRLDRFVFRYRRRAYSQFGEDLFLEAYFRDQDRGVYVDVGAFHPRQLSNTQLLHERGWRGLNVDPTPGSMRLFDALRPGDANVEAAVSDEPGTVVLHSWGLHAENTIAPEQLRAAEQALGPAPERVEVPARTLTEILDASPLRDAEIDLLTVDAEGHDLAVLRSLDWGRYRPRIVIVESFRRDLESLLVSPRYVFLREQGYRMAAWHPPSVIFEREPALGSEAR
jgi:FkbM family methyltransferase